MTQNGEAPNPDTSGPRVYSACAKRASGEWLAGQSAVPCARGGGEAGCGAM